MRARPLGKTDISISPIVFGGNVFGWTVDEGMSFRLLDASLDAGLNTVDTADIYSNWIPGNPGGVSEAIIGRWLKRGKASRDKVVIITKVGSPMAPDKKGLREKYILAAVDESLRRLQTDYIDLYLSHRPDPETPHEETLGAFAKLKDQGKIRAVGCSNFDVKLLKASLDASRNGNLPRYDVVQPEYNLYDRDAYEGAMASLCHANDLGVITYSSLASGFLTGKYRDESDVAGKARAGEVGKYLNGRGMKILSALDSVANDTGVKPAEVALSWLLHKQAVTAPIASATSLQQLQSLANAADLKLDPDAMKLLDEASA